MGRSHHQLPSFPWNPGGSGNQTIVTSGGCANLGAALTCTDAGLSNGTTYFYIVSAVESAGQSPPSNRISATTASAPSVGRVSDPLRNAYPGHSATFVSSGQVIDPQFDDAATQASGRCRSSMLACRLPAPSASLCNE